jgi:hypothetical protein
MSVADELAIIARRFYALARATSKPVTKVHLICLADSYRRQADELTEALTVNELISNRRGKTSNSRRNAHEEANAAKEQAE